MNDDEVLCDNIFLTLKQLCMYSFTAIEAFFFFTFPCSLRTYGVNFLWSLVGLTWIVCCCVPGIVAGASRHLRGRCDGQRRYYQRTSWSRPPVSVDQRPRLVWTRRDAHPLPKFQSEISVMRKLRCALIIHYSIKTIIRISYYHSMPNCQLLFIPLDFRNIKSYFLNPFDERNYFCYI